MHPHRLGAVFSFLFNKWKPIALKKNTGQKQTKPREAGDEEKMSKKNKPMTRETN